MALWLMVVLLVLLLVLFSKTAVASVTVFSTPRTRLVHSSVLPASVTTHHNFASSPASAADASTFSASPPHPSRPLALAKTGFVRWREGQVLLRRVGRKIIGARATTDVHRQVTTTASSESSQRTTAATTYSSCSSISNASNGAGRSSSGKEDRRPRREVDMGLSKAGQKSRGDKEGQKDGCTTHGSSKEAGSSCWNGHRAIATSSHGLFGWSSTSEKCNSFCCSRLPSSLSWSSSSGNVSPERPRFAPMSSLSQTGNARYGTFVRSQPESVNDTDEFAEIVRKIGDINLREKPLRPLVWNNGTYEDNLFDLGMTAAFRLVMGSVAEWQSSKSFMPTYPGESYDGLVEVAQALQYGKGPSAFEAAVIQILDRFPRHPQMLQDNKVSMELLGFLTPILFAFLVGPSKVESWKREEDGSTWQSKVKIQKCRFLTQTGCAGMCVGLCQRPTQRFFNEVAGIPLAMEPNFDDCSCTMTWGKKPVSRQEDPAGKQGCFTWCPTAPSSTSMQPKSQSNENAATAAFSSDSLSHALPTKSKPCPRLLTAELKRTDP
eukprot:CAMPEP_0184491004 /NCGR_PEP_ID=MMETSP0113_2-20130426/19411_1 /TAXON_ID=91329 /ORGANISM="Norrisiella sphaerica, Strain BC52" /LENGTH=548 /DNA_ID=CAMNT_0026875171 /DNA_START=193 /DNA_END=1839 /DNA_ORIENTATION=+